MNYRKKRTKNQRKYAEARAEKPDELLMICIKHQEFGKRFAEEFRRVLSERGQRNG